MSRRKEPYGGGLTVPSLMETYRTVEEYCSIITAIAVAKLPINGNGAFDRPSNRFINPNNGRNASIDIDTFCSWHVDEEDVTNSFLESKGITDVIVRPLISDVVWWLSNKHHLLFGIVPEIADNGYDIVYKYAVSSDDRFADKAVYRGQCASLHEALDLACYYGCKLLSEIEY